jgi:hypothetical protein
MKENYDTRRDENQNSRGCVESYLIDQHDQRQQAMNNEPSPQSAIRGRPRLLPSSGTGLALFFSGGEYTDEVNRVQVRSLSHRSMFVGGATLPSATEGCKIPDVIERVGTDE